MSSASTTENAVKTFKYRAFVAMMMVFSGLGLPVTGIANHAYGFAPLWVERHTWMSSLHATAPAPDPTVERHALVVEEDAQFLPPVVGVADRGGDGALGRMTVSLAVEPRLHPGADRTGALFPKLQLCGADQTLRVGGVLGDVQLRDQVEHLPVGSGAGAVVCRVPLAVSAVSSFVPV
jgi:hypothetical protein